MATLYSPNVVNTGLGLLFDAANPRSFRGGPTTNILPSASANGRFTTSNGWGTYNVNQYNSNTYFSIGTVSSVSNNIVTTSSNHPLRTFDVVRAQTTGGGITAGTNYFIKKISNTSFSIHQYNSSQNGSQGYLDPSTGFHKVHDSIANDQRISINSTSFPTMWWGPPHLPNAGLVKEIVQDGGYVSGTNCMRLHIPRTSGIDGMAYGVYSPVTQGDSITVSYWAKTNAVGAAGSATLGFSTYFGPGQSSYARYSDVLTEDWQLITHNWTASATYSFYKYFWPSTESSPYWIDIADLMVEIGPAPTTTRFFTTGTRGTTVATDGGWADLSGNVNHGQLVNGPTFNSDSSGNIVFDGADDKILVNSFSYTPYCLDFWLYNNNTVPGNDSAIGGPSSYQTLLSFGGGTPGINLGGWTGAASNEALHIWSTSGGSKLTYTRDALSPGIYNWVFNWNGSHYDIWVNGVKQTVYASTGGHASLISYNTTMYIGSDNVTYEFYGKIYTFKMYTSSLTDAQVIQNFNATRNRFGV